MYEANSTPSEPSLLDSMIRIFEAGQRVILDRLDLAYFDLTQFASRTLRGAALIVVGAVVLAGAWFVLIGGVVVWMQQYLSLPVSLALVAGASVLVGAACIVIGTKRAQSGAVEATNDLIESVREGAPDDMVAPANGASSHE